MLALIAVQNTNANTHHTHI